MGATEIFRTFSSIFSAGRTGIGVALKNGFSCINISHD